MKDHPDIKKINNVFKSIYITIFYIPINKINYKAKRLNTILTSLQTRSSFNTDSGNGMKPNYQKE
jgi:hypothetical protein